MVNIKHPGTLSIEETGSDNSSGAGSRNKVTMTTLGKIGRFGDQILQYSFLRIYANVHGLDVETPDWDGRLLFALNDTICSKDYYVDLNRKLRLGTDAMLPVILDYLGVDWKNAFGLLIRKYKVPVLDIAVEFIKGNDILAGNKGPPCMDLFGWFQFHTSYYASHKTFLRSLFHPVKVVEDTLLEAWGRVKSKGNTIIGIHLRRGDRMNIPLNTCEWIAPVQWYLQWLETHWHTFDRPVLFLASDSIDKVKGYFSNYRPVTTSSLLQDFPNIRCGELNKIPAYYPDFYFLSLCDIVAISNSMFSFTASMLNERGRTFVRPNLGTRGLIPFDPWNSKPIVRRNMYTSFCRRYGEYLRLSYLAGGVSEVQKSLFKRIPKYWLLRWTINNAARFYGRRLSFHFESY
jgi:hypothetical protein